MGFFCLPLLLVCSGLSTALLILLHQPPGLSPAPPLLCWELISQPPALLPQTSPTWPVTAKLPKVAMGSEKPNL